MLDLVLDVQHHTDVGLLEHSLAYLKMLKLVLEGSHELLVIRNDGSLGWLLLLLLGLVGTKQRVEHGRASLR